MHFLQNHQIKPSSIEEDMKQVAVTVIIEEVKTNPNGEKLKHLWEYEEILDILGFGKVQWILLLISGLFTMASMAAQLSLGVISISSKCEFNMSQGEMGLMISSCVMGILLSTYIWGYISDLWGRRTVLLRSIFVANCLQFILIFVNNMWLFNFINLLIGISLGGISGVIYPYLGEFNTTKNRPVVINYSTMFVAVTAIYVPAISWLILSFDWSLEITETYVFKPWRLIILLCLLPGFIGGLLMLPFPESPKHLLAHHKETEALEALNWIAKSNKGLELYEILQTSKIYLKTEELAVGDTKELPKGLKILTSLWKSTMPLFYKPYGFNVLLAVLAIFGMMFCSNGLQFWFPEIVNRSTRGLISGQAATVCEILKESYERDNINATRTMENLSVNEFCDPSISTQTYIHSIIMGFTFLVGFTLQGILLKPLGRKNLLLASLAVGAISSILLNFVTNTSGVLVLFCLCILIPGLTISVMCSGIVDLVPTHLRGKAVSMGFTLGRLGVILASHLIGAMLGSYCSALFDIVAGTLLVCVVLVYFLPI